MSLELSHFIIPNWPSPPQVRAYCTTRQGGYSTSPFISFNLADHVGDDSEKVAANRALLQRVLNLPNEPLWLQQVHGIQAVAVQTNAPGCCADAAYTAIAHQICVVLTADCLPVLFCNRAGTRVAAAHAGWRGLASGILESTLQHLAVSPEEMLVWLGPAISQRAFEVGEEVRSAFVAQLPQASVAFIPSRSGHWYADLYLLAKQRLAQCGVTAVYGGEFCTYTDVERFYSYRRDQQTGRMASLIWIDRL